jgi:hypothetical protein
MFRVRILYQRYRRLLARLVAVVIGASAGALLTLPMPNANAGDAAPVAKVAVAMPAPAVVPTEADVVRLPTELLYLPSRTESARFAAFYSNPGRPG